MTAPRKVVPYPRRRAIRGFLRTLTRIAFPVLANLEVEGRENIPEGGLSANAASCR